MTSIVLFCLFVLINALCPSQQQWSCRDIASILWDFYPTLGCHDTQGFRPGQTQTGLYNYRRWLEAWNFGFNKKRNCTIRVAKTKALISFRVTAKLICSLFSHRQKNFFFHNADHVTPVIPTTLGVFDLSALGKGANREGIGRPIYDHWFLFDTLGGRRLVGIKLDAGRVICS